MGSKYAVVCLVVRATWMIRKPNHLYLVVADDLR
jgi:hypothetical protein